LPDNLHTYTYAEYYTSSPSLYPLVPLAEIWSQAPYFQELGPSIAKITTSRFYGETLRFGT
jgi:hypothetical protein